MTFPSVPPPRELAFGGIYVSPLLPSVLLALGLAWLTCLLLHHRRRGRSLRAPTLVFLSLTAIYAVLLSTLLFPS